MILSEAKKKILMLIDEYSTRGIINSSSNIADYEKKLNSYLDMAQLHIAETKHIKRNFLISQYLPFTPSFSQFESVPHSDTDITYSGKGYAYHFAVDGYADVYIEGVDSNGDITEIDTVFAYSDGGFKRFKGLVEENYTSINIRFSGDNFYNIKDVAIFNVKYYSEDKIPNFSRYIPYEMPKDYLLPLKAELRTQYKSEPLTDFQWENPKTIGISAFVQGEIRIEYAAKPTTITDETADTYKFEIGEYEQGAMIYYVAALCLQTTNFNVYSLLMQQYTEKMMNSETKQLLQTKVKRVRYV